jgi:cytochrome c oxidase subunit 2
MPIQVRVVSDQEFAAWIEGAKKKFADNGSSAPAIEAAEADHSKAEAATKLAAADRQ